MQLWTCYLRKKGGFDAVRFNTYHEKLFFVSNLQHPEFQMISTNDVEMFIDETIHLHGLNSNKISAHHNSVQFAVIIAGDLTGAIKIEPSLLVLTNAEHRLVDAATFIRTDACQHRPHVPVDTKLLTSLECHPFFYYH